MIDFQNGLCSLLFNCPVAFIITVVTMALLTEEMFDGITEGEIESLNRANIWNVNDLCSNELMDMKRETKIRYPLLKNLVEHVRQRYTLPLFDCDYTCANSLKDLKLCPTGLPELTAALDSGYQTQEIVELTGDSGTGKTEMCYLFCATFLSHYPKYDILYVASQSDFETEKLSKYIRSKTMSETELSDENIFNHLQRVSVARPSRLADFVHLLNTIVHSDLQDKIRCIIIDSLSFILQDDLLELKTCESDRDAIDIYLGGVMRILTNIAINKNVIIFLTNANYSQLSYNKNWSNGIHHRIHLTDNPRRATILKTIHNLTRINYSVPFEINDEGLFTVRFPKPPEPSASSSDSNKNTDPQQYQQEQPGD